MRISPPKLSDAKYVGDDIRAKDARIAELEKALESLPAAVAARTREIAARFKHDWPATAIQMGWPECFKEQA